jgi:membrane protein implicated in regulation of membrane protease activity
MTDLLVSAVLIALLYYGYHWYKAREQAKERRRKQHKGQELKGSIGDRDIP